MRLFNYAACVNNVPGGFLRIFPGCILASNEHEAHGMALAIARLKYTHPEWTNHQLWVQETPMVFIEQVCNATNP